MSSRIDSPFGTLGARVAATADAEERRRDDADLGDGVAELWLADPGLPEGAEERPVGMGRWVEYRTDQQGWQPAFLVAWRRYSRQHPWLARVVLVTEPGLTAEALIPADLVRPVTAVPSGR